MKLTVNKSVFWNVGDKKMAGKVKQIMGDHVVIKAADAEYIVNKSCLSVVPISKLAAISVLAALKDKDPAMMKVEFDLETGEVKMTWLDTYDEHGRMKGCSSDPFDPFIKECDAIFIEGLEGVQVAYNQPPAPPPASVAPKQEIKKTVAPPKPIVGPGVVAPKPGIPPAKKKTII